MDEINFLRKKYFVTPDKMVCEVKDNFTFDEVVKLLREYTEYQASSHIQVVMQAEGSDVSEGAAVGQRSVGTNAEGQVCMQTLYCDVYNTKGICSYCGGKIVRKSSEGHL